jgi:hypothetical protein
MEVRMDFGVSLEVNKEMIANRSNSSQMTVEQDNNSEGLAYLTPGQVIKGSVVSVDEQVTLDFDGQKVTTPKDLLKYAIPGEIKTFEVIKASNTEIELKLLEGTVKALRQTIKAITVKEKDWETVRSQKEQAAKQSEKEKAAREALTKLEEISIKFTEQDYKALEKEGFFPETMSVSGLYEAINRVKAAMTQVGTVNTQQPGEISSVKITEDEITARLKEENLPVTKQNIERIQKAIALSDTVVKIDDKAMKYLIAREAKPTIENIYKAYYSGSAKHQEKRTELTAKEWDELEGQVMEIIQEAGYEVNSENLTDARWLLENELPVTSATFTYKKKLGEIKANTDTDIVLDRIMEGMKNGTAPKDVTLAAQSIPAIEHIITSLNTIGEEAVTYAIQEKMELNIKNLAAVQEELTAGKVSVNRAKPEEAPGHSAEVLNQRSWKAERIIATDYSDYGISDITDISKEDYTVNGTMEMEASSEDAGQSTGEENTPDNHEYMEVKAQRQLEEIRLKMTLEAAGRLENKGIHIETERLEKVVEELRKLEDSYYKKLLSEAEVESTTQALQTLRDTTQNIAQLKLQPCAVLGATLTERTTQTLPSLITSGTKLIDGFEKAGIAYETLATVPKAEYGDSIGKAFSNMDSLLSELNIENTGANQRAVRILGYNSMEITQAAIDQVKAYDKEVTAVIQNLHPAVTVRMIKDGINPLSMPIDELNTVIDRLKEEQGISSEDKFSNYLHKLERENGITPQERKAYIGIYRLLYNVEKSDGAALGAVLKADQEVTLSHLLTAVQTGRRGRVSAAVDDEFGMLTELNRNKESIADQIKGLSHPMKEAHDDRIRKESLKEEQEKYLDRVVKQIAEEISPEKLKNLQQTEGMRVTSQVAFSSENSANAADTDLWETIKNIPLEKLLEQLQEAAEKDDTYSGRYVEKVQQIRELCKNSEQSLRFLSDYQVTGSPQNIIFANHILSNGISPIVRLLKRQNENSIENSENKLKELKEVSDTLIDKSSMNEAYKNLEAQAKEALTQACSQETLDSSKLAELKNIGQQLTFLRNMASREFYQIPIETDKGITNMNLTILRGSGITGRVSVTVWSKELGDIKAEFSLKEKSVKGFIACDNRNGLKRLQMEAAEIETAAKESNINLKQLDFGISGKDYESYNYQNPRDLGQNTGEDLNTERALYRLAKAIVQTVRLAENNLN